MIAFIENFHWLRPAFLLLLPVIIALEWLMRTKQAGNDQWQGVIEPHLLEHLTITQHRKRPRQRQRSHYFSCSRW